MKTDSLKVAIESELVITTNELIAENIMLKKANKTILKQIWAGFKFFFKSLGQTDV